MQRRTRVIAASLAVVAAAGVGTAVAEAGSKPPSNRVMVGAGINEYGMTKSFFKGGTVNFTYTKGFYCDTKVKSKASSGCEAGATFKKPPATNFDPLYITVPLGFSVPAMKMECPNGLVCVDHPGTIDLSRLEPALKPLYPGVSKKQLKKALDNATTPGHEHFITTLNGTKPEWWDVKVIGVESKASWDKINKHKSYSYIEKLQKNSKSGVTADIPTNLFLYFGAEK